MGYARIPRNLPHAATIVVRIEGRLEALGATGHADAEELLAALEELSDCVGRYEGRPDPPELEALRVSEEAAPIARRLVDEIERLELGEDRLGQAVRNLFECLGYAQEGAEISLRAGENPNSLMRPL